MSRTYNTTVVVTCKEAVTRTRNDRRVKELENIIPVSARENEMLVTDKAETAAIHGYAFEAEPDSFLSLLFIRGRHKGKPVPRSRNPLMYSTYLPVEAAVAAVSFA